MCFIPFPSTISASSYVGHIPVVLFFGRTFKLAGLKKIIYFAYISCFGNIKLLF